ncbi:succinate dehydrogenase, hydrophobic membrane anchor protein [Hyphobacterium sp. HN65]|uniref:Succinate dehydrogenase hydrophobic membrane anchor subunit n=1 Tax=Hyphobacterium lacteum TaxID=3116575 RepID=A0ABU7LTR6_9PROT|nr:succinate dehydrogenase, hydrophobic membrane anchor protein [Hyphobacterium sp. HN65]MEE2527312.1 succinate dehydrogenase, hydrophobic membrane anchor protein [Hyphobacterium sp. HN65]
MSMVTPAKRINRLGSAKSGVHHFVAQRVSAIALVIALPLFMICLSQSGAPDPAASRAFFGSAWGALLTLITMSATLYHMRLGLQVVVEDYIHGTAMKMGLLIGNTLITYGLWLAGAYALIRLAVTG